MKFDQLLESLRVREQKEILPPRFVVEKVLKEMNAFVAQPAADNILSSSFKARAKKIKGMTDVQRTDFQNSRGGRGHEHGLSGLPEADRLFQRPPARKRPRTTVFGRLPDGEAFYAYAVRRTRPRR